MTLHTHKKAPPPKKTRSRWSPTETITERDYADNLMFLANTPAQAVSLLHCLEQTAGCMGLDVNTNKIGFMCFKKEEAISTLSGKPLKLVNKFLYLGSNISSTESDFNIHLPNPLTAMHRLSIIGKFDESD